MTPTHERKTRHRRDGAQVIRPQIPSWEGDRRIHKIQRRVRQAPWWLWAATAIVLLSAAFAAGTLWSGGRSSALSEQLAAAQTAVVELNTEREALIEQRQQLRSELATAPTAAEMERISARIQSLSEDILAKDEAIAGWAGEYAKLESELEAEHALRLSETGRANRLEATQTAESAALPGRIERQLIASPPQVTGQYELAVQHQIFREAFGFSWWGINDETLTVRAQGIAVFGLPEDSVSADWSGDRLEIKLGLPQLVAAGLNGFTPQSYSYSMGLAARLGDQDVGQLMAWVEENALLPEACSDVESLRRVITDTERRLRSAAGRYPVSIVWLDGAGREFSGYQIEEASLLDGAC